MCRGALHDQSSPPPLSAAVDHIRWSEMAFKDSGFADRLSAAANAQKAKLEKFKARPGPDDPTVLERQAARQEMLRAREAREAEREAERIKRLAEEEAARKAFEESEAIRIEAEYQARIAREAELEAEKKAARDARYAARKARK